MFLMVIVFLTALWAVAITTGRGLDGMVRVVLVVAVIGMISMVVSAVRRRRHARGGV